MVLRFQPACWQCAGKGWYRQPDPAGRGDAVDCRECSPTPLPAPSMPPTRFLACLDALRWRPAPVAEWCGYTRALASRWAKGDRSIPPQVAAWLERRMAGALDDPPGPVGVRRRGG